MLVEKKITTHPQNTREAAAEPTAKAGDENTPRQPKSRADAIPQRPRIRTESPKRRQPNAGCTETTTRKQR